MKIYLHILHLLHIGLLALLLLSSHTVIAADTTATTSTETAVTTDNEASTETANVEPTNSYVSMKLRDIVKDPKLMHLAIESALATHNMDNLRILLPIYQKFPEEQRDTQLLLYASAILAQSQGQDKVAIQIYRYLIASGPNNDAARLGLAILLFNDNQNIASRYQFNKLKSQPLEPQIKQLIDMYLTALSQRTELGVDFNFNITQDNNINNNINKEDAISAIGLEYSFGINKDFNLRDNYFLQYALSNYGTYYPKQPNYGSHTTHLDFFGIAYKNGQRELSIKPFFSMYWSDYKPYSNYYGGSLSWDEWLTNKFKLTTYFSAGKIDHKDQTYYNLYNCHVYTLSQSYLYIQNPQLAWFARLAYNTRINDSHYKEEEYDQYSLRMGFTKEWYKGISTKLSFQVGNKTYKGPFLWFPTRKDRQFDTELSVWHRAVNFWGVTPKFTIKHERNYSNIPEMYSKQNTNLSVELGRTF